MRRKLLELIICPDCHGDLQLLAVDQEADEIVQGKIGCPACGRTYPIEDGLVYLLPEERLDYCRQEDAAHEQALGGGGFFDWVKDDVFYHWPHQMPPDPSPELRWEIESHSRSFERVLEGVQGDETVLDFGSGFGWASRDFARRGCYAVALDASSFMLKKAAEYLRHFQIHFERVVSDMETLPFREGVFDLTFGAAAIHHSCDLRRTVRELARVTRLGRPVVTIKDHLRPAYLSLEEWLEGDLDSSRGIHERSFNYLDYTEAFRAAGLRPEVRPSRHYWSEQAHGASVGAHIGRSYPVLLYHALRFWLGSYVIIDIVGRKVKPRPRGERAFSLRRALNRRGLFTLLFRLFAPQKKGGIEREKLLYIARVQAPSSVVRREMVYQVEVASNSAERRRVQLAYDLYPLANGRHPDRHVGWWAKNIDLEPGEKKRLQVKFSPEYMQAVFRLAGSYERADSSWLGDYYQANRFYKTGFFLYDEQGEQVHGYVLLQRFLA